MAGRDPRAQILRFSVFELDLERRELHRRGVLVPLPPQAFTVLEELLWHAGQVVTRDEMRRALWPDGDDVDHERGLNYCVNRVRRALGDDAQTRASSRRFPGAAIASWPRWTSSSPCRAPSSERLLPRRLAA
jgi:DNA-binding response OmpR family regulator